MKRYFDKNKKPLKAGVEGPYSLTCKANTNQWNDSGCAENIIWDGDVPRFRIAEEQEAWFEKKRLDSMTKLSKLELSRALKDLNLWKEEVKSLIKASEDFDDDWSNSDVIDLTDPVFLQGFSMTSIDMDTVKRKIIELRGAEEII